MNDDSAPAEPGAGTGNAPTGARADAVTGVVLVVLGAAVAVESWRMPRMAEFGSSVWSGPGVVPGMIGLALAAMGAVLFLRARPGLSRARGAAPEPGATRRVLVTFGLCTGFAAGLVGLVPFAIAAFAFVLAFIALFDREDRRVELGSGANAVGDADGDAREADGRAPDDGAGAPVGPGRFGPESTARRLALAVAIAAAASFAITSVFEDVFFVRLP